jgi:hypothetical protein
MKSFRVVLFAFVFVLLAAPGAAHATGTLDQSQTRIDGIDGIPVYSQQWVAQTFTAGLTGTLDQVDVAIARQESPGPLIVQIRTVLPDGTPGGLLATAMVPEASAPVWPTFTFVAVPLAPGTVSVAGTHYAIVLGNLSPPPGLGGQVVNYRWGDACGAVFVPPSCTGAVGSPYPGGSVLTSKDLGTTWEKFGPTFAMAFKTYVTQPPAVCPPGDSDDLNGGGDNDENDGSGAKSLLALSGFSQALLQSVNSDECDNDQHDQNGDNDGGGSDGD